MASDLPANRTGSRVARSRFPTGRAWCADGHYEGDTTMQVGFIGLGIMGRPMAVNLARAGHALLVPGYKRIPDDVAAAGAVACGSAKEIAQRAEVVIVMVPDTPDVASVLFDPGGVAEGVSPGKVVVDMSSISPLDTKAFAARITELGGHYLDAPVSGGEVGARGATL